MEKLFESIDEDPELLVVNSQPACLSLNHWDHEPGGARLRRALTSNG